MTPADDDPPPPGPDPRRRPRLLDLVGLTVGYGVAAVLMRAFRPTGAASARWVSVAFGIVYLWMGLCVSGPIVLLLERRPGRPAARRPPADRPPPGRDREPGVGPQGPRSRFTGAELAWLTIGGYWIGMAAFLIPTRLDDTPLWLLLVFQTIAATGLWVAVPRRRGPSQAEAAWTHRAAIAVLATWPVAWVALILLARG